MTRPSQLLFSWGRTTVPFYLDLFAIHLAGVRLNWDDLLPFFGLGHRTNPPFWRLTACAYGGRQEGLGVIVTSLRIILNHYHNQEIVPLAAVLPSVLLLEKLGQKGA